MPGNYTYQEYLFLIASADTLDELDTVDELLKQDREALDIDINEYIRIKATWTLKLTDITIEEAKKKME